MLYSIPLSAPPLTLDLPFEVWLRVISYITEEDILRLSSLNQAFWSSALDIKYRTLDLSYRVHIQGRYHGLNWWSRPLRLFTLTKIVKRYREPDIPYRVERVRLSPSLDYVTWWTPWWHSIRIPNNPILLIVVSIALLIHLSLLYVLVWPWRWSSWLRALLNPNFYWAKLFLTPQVNAIIEKNLDSTKIRTLEILDVPHAHPMYVKSIRPHHCQYIQTALAQFSQTLTRLVLRDLRDPDNIPTSLELPSLRSFKFTIRYFIDGPIHKPLLKLQAILSHSPLLEQIDLEYRLTRPQHLPLPSNRYIYTRLKSFSLTWYLDNGYYNSIDMGNGSELGRFLRLYERQLKRQELVQVPDMMVFSQITHPWARSDRGWAQWTR